MHVAVLASPESWYLADLRRAAGAKHRISRVSFSQLASRLDGRSLSVVSSGIDLSTVDCVLVRTMPPGSLEQVVFRMDALARLEAADTVIVNPPKSLEAAVDKYLASAILQAAGLPVPRTVVCQTVDDAMAAFGLLGGDVVVKPLFGSEGRGIARVTDEALALRAFKALVQFQSVLYLQEFIPHEGFDLRLLLVGERVLAMKRINHADWRTNVARGAATEPFQPTDEMIQIARSAAETAGAPLAGVDLLQGRNGRLYVLEVNAVPGWKALAATLQVDVAAIVLDYLVDATVVRGRCCS
jgi:ribosomal protein S6--L-glutamate ligase